MNHWWSDHCGGSILSGSAKNEQNLKINLSDEKKLLLLALFVMGLSCAFEQTEADSISIKKVFGG